MQIQLLLLDGVFDTGMAAFADCMAVANLLGAAQGGVGTVSRVGVRKRVTTAQGHTITTDGTIRTQPLPDVLVVPALGTLTPETLAAALRRPDIAAAGRFLTRCQQQGILIGSACTGTFVLAQSGILDGLRATTTWWLEPLFRARYPAVRVDASQMIVAEPGVVTAGAAMGHLDLALWFVAQVSASLAQTTARYLLFDERMYQASYAMPDHLVHDDPLVVAFEVWARDHLRDFSVDRAADALSTSPRSLQRRIRRVLGRTPLAYVQEIRAQQAIQLLRSTDDSVDTIAAVVGYADAMTLRAVLRKTTGRGIRELRRRH